MDVPTDTSSPPPIDSTMMPQKRKRSPSLEPISQPAPPMKTQKISSSSHLHINYLARQYTDTLPLISTHDHLPDMLSLIADYDGVLHRHESMAGNLGARPLGPILVQRFERLFDGPPQVLKTNAKDSSTVNIGWLDVVEFARNKPEQFNLEKMRDGVRVCQFYTKQCRVEISEEDYQLISSGIPQKMIPPQPIGDDEEKELGTLEILEKNLASVIQAADQVASKARQLNHKLKNRKAAIISRRQAEKPEKPEPNNRPEVGLTNGDARPSVSPPAGFVAVNSKSQTSAEPSTRLDVDNLRSNSATLSNGHTTLGASAATHAELLSKFHTSNERQTLPADVDRRSSISNNRSNVPSKGKSRYASEQLEYAGFLNATASPVAIPNTPSALIPQAKMTLSEKLDDSGPFKSDMMLRMEQLNRGDRVKPPCDRCRRLHMDCLKNLTACMGCTKKHAKCSWKDVEEQELREHPLVTRVTLDGKDADDGDESRKDSGSEEAKKEWGKEGLQGVRDEELLGEESDDDEGELKILGPSETDRRVEAKSHSPTTGYAINKVGDSRDGAKSAPATTMHPSPISQLRTENAGPATAPLPPNMSHSIIKKPDIPLYKSPSENSHSGARVFTAHEWDTYTRRSPTNKSRATPSSDIHDELKSAALEAERNYARRADDRQEQNRERKDSPMRVYVKGSDPGSSSASTAVAASTEVRATEAGKANGQPTPPPERAEAKAGKETVIAVPERQIPSVQSPGGMINQVAKVKHESVPTAVAGFEVRA
ncbi:uncharacterized protein KY384_006481 [Bacidia gigantensis]|uniref:uncharacterized protein n=1 Tax=Bacidia gigantensis TaxID=2732470 RepID=UPI001D051AD5|nr:uncharacterized protein KY384_006481 [Bacidia gigantensis]KAG8528793.1 hypothetical protein KY384_006481 [Bacidia gigantensis]